jgi:hypothetical protein
MISAAVNNTGMEKLSLQDLYPPRGEDSFHLLKDDGSLTISILRISTQHRKFLLQGL